ncbi:3-methyladenine DNA glycosylase [Poseidonibacter antarcticus]|uniref:3-methyladenine DNA glycosylase n=1 Tax=Poseidonibacter antarcticus TaxID=2478538 RepID=UPI000EF4ED89|nr:3-methyladenine DNA glycosylase [Poseidonibacter antarcticus]
MISISNSYDLLLFLKEQNLIDEKDEYWWPNDNSFEILLGAILTQNTKWTNVEKSLDNLKNLNINSLEKLSQIDLQTLIFAITPSGFKNQKSVRLISLSKNILEVFGTFENFCLKVDRRWLLEQKGIGPETADAILCYSCKQEYMVVDSYTNRLLKRFGYEFESYEELQNWCEYGINENYDKIAKLYNYEISLNKVYSRFHGKIIEFMKRNPKG